MDATAMFKISYGLYVVGTAYDGKLNAQIANTVVQINSEPVVTIAASLNNNNYTNELVKKSGIFSVNVLSDQTEMPFISNFGHRSGRDFDKFAAYKPEFGQTGAPLLSGKEIAACIEARVIKSFEAGTHTIFLGEVVDAYKSEYNQMTYADYHKLKAAAAAPAAPAANPSGKKYRCTVCGYIHEGEMPADFKCPVCGVGPDKFVEI